MYADGLGLLCPKMSCDGHRKRTRTRRQRPTVLCRTQTRVSPCSPMRTCSESSLPSPPLSYPTCAYFYPGVISCQLALVACRRIEGPYSQLETGFRGTQADRKYPSPEDPTRSKRCELVAICKAALEMIINNRTFT